MHRLVERLTEFYKKIDLTFRQFRELNLCPSIPRFVAAIRDDSTAVRTREPFPTGVLSFAARRPDRAASDYRSVDNDRRVCPARCRRFHRGNCFGFCLCKPLHIGFGRFSAISDSSISATLFLNFQPTAESISERLGLPEARIRCGSSTAIRVLFSISLGSRLR